MSANGRQARNASASATAPIRRGCPPRGGTYHFTEQIRFAIGIVRTDGLGERILTDAYHNEGPT